MGLEHLPGPTRGLWLRLRGEALLSGFVLVGGTALALALGHRVSEDLDLAWPGTRLPRPAINALLAGLLDEGRRIERTPRLADEHEFDDAGLDLLDYQQDFLIDGVRVSLFTPEVELGRVLLAAHAGVGGSGPRVPDLATLFTTKVLTVAYRNRSRDWVDLYLLMRDHGFTGDDLFAVVEAQVPHAWATIIGRLTRAQPGLADEGFALLVKDPPELVDIRRHFAAIRRAVESRRAPRAGPGG